jgi:hypothetical protein
MTYTIDVHLSPDDVRRRMRADACRRAAGEDKVDPAGVVLRRAGQPALRGDHPAARVLPDPGRARPAGGARAGDRRAVEGRHPGRARRRLVREDPGAPDALQQFGTLARYVPFDVSDEFLRDAASTLSDEYDGLASTWSSATSASTWRRSPPTAAAWSRSWVGPSATSTRPDGPGSSSTSTAPCRATTHCSSAPTWSRTGSAWWRPTTTPPA